MIGTVLLFIAWFIFSVLACDIIAGVMFNGLDRILKNPDRPRGALYTFLILPTSLIMFIVCSMAFNSKIADLIGLNERIERDFNYSFKIEKKQPDMAKDLGTDMGAD